MEAIASVVLNRVHFSKQKKGYWWGNTIKEVCLKPKQFSCWNKNDANYELIKKVGEKNTVFQICKRIAKRAEAGLLKDNLKAATHYHTKQISPKWTVGKIACVEIGNHLFYNDIER